MAVNRRLLEQRALKAWHAYICCVRGRSDTSRGLSDVANFIEMAAQGVRGIISALAVLPSVRLPKGSLVVSPLPANATPGAPAPTMPIPGDVYQLPLPESYQYGFVDLETGEVLDTFPQNLASPEALVKGFRAFATSVRKRSPELCQQCIERYIFGQQKPRMRGRFVLYGGKYEDGSPIRVRIPHE